MQINKIVIHLAFALVWHLCGTVSTASATDPANGGRVALVIGNSRYESTAGPLRNTVNDAKAMANTLRSLGFFVVEKHNVTRGELLTALLQFRSKLHGAEVGIFYFAGHGISVAGSNYLLPVKSGYNPADGSETDLRLLAETRLFNAEEAVADMSEAGAGCNLVILDACRSTPLARNPRVRGSARGGLVEMNPPAGSLIAFATDAGHEASDGSAANGLYTTELMKHLRTPGLTIEQVFKRTRAGVMQRSGGTQLPAEYSRLVGDDIYLAGPASAKSPEPAKLAEVARAAETAKSADEAISKNQTAPVPIHPEIDKPAAGNGAAERAIHQVPTLAEIDKLPIADDAAACVESLRAYVRSRGPSAHIAAPLAALLKNAKDILRDPKTTPESAERVLQNCGIILAAIPDLLPAGDPQRKAFSAKAFNRQGDALLLLGRAQEALASFNSAASLDPSDGYIIYNRGRALLALDRKDEAKTDFTTTASARFKKSGVHKLAEEALAGMR